MTKVKVKVKKEKTTPGDEGVVKFKVTITDLEFRSGPSRGLYEPTKKDGTEASFVIKSLVIETETPASVHSSLSNELLDSLSALFQSSLTSPSNN
jgi:hypothetical protein